jgi:crossover junction endodeoxyribonuclease RusA
MSMKRSVEWLAEYEGRVARWRKIAREWNGDNIELVELTSGEPVPVLADRNQTGSSLTNHEDARTRKDRERPLAPVTSSPSMPTEGGVVNQPAPGAPPSPVAASSAAPIVLPWAPTGNTAVRHAGGAHYLRPEVIEYRKTVAAILCRHERIRGPYTLEVELSPPDARRRDADNALKSILDAAVKCGWLPDDSMTYMRELHVYVKSDRRGSVSLRAIDVPRVAA